MYCILIPIAIFVLLLIIGWCYCSYYNATWETLEREVSDDGPEGALITLTERNKRTGITIKTQYWTDDPYGIGHE